jgi:hypothetical protein
MSTSKINEPKILNLGAGVQSTTLALMAVKNWEYWHCSEPLPYPVVDLVNYALFADTMGEPKAVYRHLDWLKPILKKFICVVVVSKGNLAHNLQFGVNGDLGRFI